MKKLKVVILAALIIFCGGTLAAAPLARTNNYDTIKTISSVTQSTLNEMAASGQVAAVYVSAMEFETRPLRKYYVRILPDRMKQQQYMRLRYCNELCAVSDSGVYFYSSKTAMMRYYPYRLLSLIHTGRPLGYRVGVNMCVNVLGWAIVGGVVGGSSYVVEGIAIGAFVGAYIGGNIGVGQAVLFALNGLSKNVKYDIHGDVSRGAEFRKQLLKAKPKLSEWVDISTFPVGFDQPSLPPDTSFVVSRVETKSAVVDSGAAISVSRAEVSVSASPALLGDTLPEFANQSAALPEAPPVATPKPLVSEVSQPPVDVVSQPPAASAKPVGMKWGNFEVEKGYSSHWMCADFVASEVRTSYLSNQFSSIRQRAITSSDLNKLKSRSEIQFLAIWITTAAGYNFRELVAFNGEQLKFIQPKEPYLAEDVNGKTILDPQVFLEVDLENLKVLFEALNQRYQ